ncbi:glucose-6-phosphate 1-dehydrogenase [Nematocida homosporus]|uniref:glucose-6-phosphate 1-dehydrogenase n=1 Tax=Nematocida homosporus TaxID=1912981 RepID=UPI00221E3B80|nr:glucose-6-phosphate 1-dehydrogenase [Nematocida homosporus]KAI5187060.1 glucose-6-phosphate 1-dehydrogenase [Nematocida homosporus]
MLVILGCTGDLCRTKIFPAINTMLRQKLSQCTKTEYNQAELEMTQGTLSSSVSTIKLDQSPMTQAFPHDRRNRTEYLKAEDQEIIPKEMPQWDILKNSGVSIPRIVGYARTVMSTEEFIRRIDPSVTYLRETVLAIKYVYGPYEECLARLATELPEEEDEPIYLYMATPPEVYPGIIEQVKQSKRRIVVLAEKPFGVSLASFHLLKEQVADINKQVLCVDHYLFKTLLLQMPEIHRHPVYQEIIQPKYLSSIAGYFKEVAGVKGRLGYFNGAGMCRDVLQNHLLLVVTLALTPGSKLDVLKEIAALQPETTIKKVYSGYQAELQAHGITAPALETYIKTKTHLGGIWNLPLVLECGKKMKTHFVGVIMELSPAGVLYVCDLPIGEHDYENTKKKTRLAPAKLKGQLEVSITPKEYIHLSLFYKKALIKRVRIYLEGSPPRHTAYQSLFAQILFQTQTDQNFSTIPELEEQWRIVDPVLEQPPANL